MFTISGCRANVLTVDQKPFSMVIYPIQNTSDIPLDEKFYSVSEQPPRMPHIIQDLEYP